VSTPGDNLTAAPNQDGRKEGAHLAGANRHGATLEAGQVDILVIANDAPLAPMVWSKLVAQVAKTHGQVEVVADHPALEVLGGVGALLRYRTRG
jgi:peptide chain release factor subunit 1